MPLPDLQSLDHPLVRPGLTRPRLFAGPGADAASAHFLGTGAGAGARWSPA